MASLMLVGGCCASPPPSPLPPQVVPPEQEKGVGRFDIDCGDAEAPALLESEPKARYSVYPNGLTYIDRAAPPGTLRLIGGRPGVVRIARLRGGGRTTLACGNVVPNKTYGVKGDFDDWSLLDIDLFGPPLSRLASRGDEIIKLQSTRLAESRAKNAEYAQAFLRWQLLSGIDTKIRADLHEGLPALVKIAARRADVAKALEPLSSSTGSDLRCSGTGPNFPFRKERCEQVKEVRETLTALAKELEKPAPEQKVLDEKAAALVPKAPATPKDGMKEYCALENKLRAIESDHPIFRILHAEVPAGNRFSEITFDAGEYEMTAEQSPLAVVVHAVPPGRALTSQVKVSDVKNTSPAEVLAAFLPVVLKAAALKAADTVTGPCGDEAPMEPPAETVAPNETRAFIVVPRLRKETTLAVCEGDKCTADGATPSVRNTVTMHPRDHVRAALLVDFGASFGKVGGANAYAKPRYESVTGNDTLTQGFALRDDTDLRRNFLFSFMVGARSDDWLAAIGPGLVDLSGDAALNQWNLRLGRRLAKDFFFTAGGGVRFVQRPQDSVASAIILPRTADAEASPPNVPTDTTLGWSVGIGVAVDLSIFPDAGKAIVSTIRGENGEKQ